MDQIIRDLVEVSITMTKKRIREEIKAQVDAVVEEKILDALIGSNATAKERESFRSLLREGLMDDRTIDVEIVSKPSGDSRGFVMDAGMNPNWVAGEIFKMAKGGGRRSEKKNLTVREARPIIQENESERMLEDYDVIKEAIAAVEESGIVFIDEIDKLVNSSEYRGADASSEGVQRDLLPIIEGSTINTKHGNVNTDYILFICSGAFHAVKPSDLLAELQGRLPIRVHLKGLTEEDMYRILTEPESSLIRQQVTHCDVAYCLLLY